VYSKEGLQDEDIAHMPRFRPDEGVGVTKQEIHTEKMCEVYLTKLIKGTLK
jgi:hypothetical protein